MSGRYPQDDPKNIIGYIADLPDPGLVPAGYIYHALDTLQSFISVVDIATRVRRWDLISSASQNLKFSGSIVSTRIGIVGPPGQQILPMSDYGSLLSSNAPNGTFLQYIPSVSSSQVSMLVNVGANTCAANVALAIYKNGVPSGVQLNITAGATGKFSLPQTALAISAVALDGVDLVAILQEAVNGNSFIFSAMVQLI